MKETFSLIILFYFINLQGQINEMDRLAFEQYITNHHYNSIDDNFFIKAYSASNDVNDKEFFKLLRVHNLLKKNQTEKAIDIYNSQSYVIEVSLKKMIQGILNLIQDDTIKAKNDFKESYELNPKNKWLNLELFHFYFDKDNVMAWKFLEDCIKIDPYFNEAIITRSLYYDSELNCQDIINDLNSLHENYKDNIALYWLGTAYINCGDLHQALHFLYESLKIEKMSDTHLSLALAYHEYLNNFEKAAYHYKKAIELEESNTSAINSYAWFLYDQGRLTEAESYFLSILNFDNNQEVYNQIIRFYIITKQFKKAKNINEKSSKKNGVNYLNSGYKIIINVLEGNEYQNLVNDYKKVYDEDNIDWLKSQLIEFYDKN